MTDRFEGHHPLQINSVERVPLGHDQIALRIRGIWRDRRQVPPGRAQLVIDIEGRFNRFPVAPDAHGLPETEPGEWRASFALPSSLEPYLKRDRTYLELGSELVRLPRATEASVLPAPRIHGDAAAQLTARIRHLERSLATARQEPSRLRELLARTQADLDARIAQQDHFESMRADLRAELSHQRAAAEHERARRAELESRLTILNDRTGELRVTLADATVAKEAAEREAAGLRAELGRLGSALSAVHEQSGRGASDVAEAQTLLVQARSLKTQIFARHNGSPSAVEEG